MICQNYEIGYVWKPGFFKSGSLFNIEANVHICIKFHFSKPVKLAINDKILTLACKPVF